MSVILYHLSVPGFAGGLVGVDIFFVVSGFVITRLLLSDFSSDSLTLVAFYERRVRRLAPGLIAMLLACFVAAYIWLVPEEFEQFTRSLLATALCVSNIFFARYYGDYFAPDASTNPLLHTWTLAVEEQFYLLYPAGLLLLLRLGASKGIIIAVIAGIAAISLSLACVGGMNFPAYSFYLLPTRAWELMLGALVAQSVIPALPRAVGQALSLLGVVFIACGIGGVLTPAFFVPQSLLACLGTAIIISANSSTTTFAKTILSNKALVGVGVLSYSLYLWHWPTIVFYRLVFSEILSAFDVAIIISITAIVSVGSWMLVEQPIRERRIFAGRKAVFSIACIAMACFVATSVFAVATNRLPPRLQPVAQLADGKNDVNPARGRCILKQPGDVLKGEFCRLGDAAPSFMIWGDSHADPWMPVFQDLARRSGTAGLFAAHGGCPPLLGIRRVNQQAAHKCMEFNEAVFDKIVESGIKNVVLIGRWSWYIHGVEKGGVEDGQGPIINQVGQIDYTAADLSSRERVFRAAVAETVKRLRSIGTQIWIIDQPPTYTFYVPQYLARRAARGAPVTGRTRAEVRWQQAFQLDVFRANNLRVIDTSDYLCPSSERFCLMQMDGRSLYSDYNHLSVFGARAVMKLAAFDFFELTRVDAKGAL